MTYDELLDDIYWHWRKDDRGDGLKPMLDYRSAILSVVQLHINHGNCGMPAADMLNPCPAINTCHECGTKVLWPCPTIQVIYKELK